MWRSVLILWQSNAASDFFTFCVGIRTWTASKSNSKHKDDTLSLAPSWLQIHTGICPRTFCIFSCTLLALINTCSAISHFTLQDSMMHPDVPQTIKEFAELQCMKWKHSHFTLNWAKKSSTYRYVLKTWCVVLGLARRFSPHSHRKVSRAEQNRTKPIRLGKQTNVMKWKHSHFTLNRAEPSFTYVLCIPIQVSWQPTPFWSLRVALNTSCCVARRADWRFAFVISLLSHHVLCEVRVKYVQRMARCLRPHSHRKPSQAEEIRIEPIQFGFENKPTLWNGSIHTSRRTEPDRIDPDSVFSGWCL